MSVGNVPRLRMFAGPNGSGKSTIKSYVGKAIGERLFGYYINPDEFEKTIRESGFIDFSNFNLKVVAAEVFGFFQNSEWLKKIGLTERITKLEFNDNKLYFTKVEINSYFASVASDFIRRKLLLSQQDFTFETVMSSPDKIEFLAEAQKVGYRTYLYYVATKDYEINISRVAHRVSEGGHDVPTDKISSRYQRSLELLPEAIKHTNRAYIFDNSADKAELVAEITDAKRIEIKINSVPTWFVKYILEKLT